MTSKGLNGITRCASDGLEHSGNHKVDTTKTMMSGIQQMMLPEDSV